MRTLVYSTHSYDEAALTSIIAHTHDLAFTDKKLSRETAAMAEGFQAVALFTADDARTPVIEELQKRGVKYIALRSVGHDHVDLGGALKCKIKVANVPSYSPNAIAEHAVAMLLALNRKLVRSQQLMELQDFRLDTLIGFDICGKTVGVVGTGKIGLVFAKIMLGFGAHVIGYDPVLGKDAQGAGIEYVSFDDLLQRSDIVSLHCPHNESTKNMLSRSAFAKMKAGAILINTARGSVVNSMDLITSLEERRIGGACLDVYDNEKELYFEDRSNTILMDDVFVRLRNLPNVIMTGHQAFLTREALKGIAQTTLENLDCWAGGKISPNELNELTIKPTTYENASPDSAPWNNHLPADPDADRGDRLQQ